MHSLIRHLFFIIVAALGIQGWENDGLSVKAQKYLARNSYNWQYWNCTWKNYHYYEPVRRLEYTIGRSDTEQYFGFEGLCVPGDIDNDGTILYFYSEQYVKNNTFDGLVGYNCSDSACTSCTVLTSSSAYQEVNKPDPNYCHPFADVDIVSKSDALPLPNNNPLFNHTDKFIVAEWYLDPSNSTGDACRGSLMSLAYYPYYSECTKITDNIWVKSNLTTRLANQDDSSIPENTTLPIVTTLGCYDDQCSANCTRSGSSSVTVHSANRCVQDYLVVGNWSGQPLPYYFGTVGGYCWSASEGKKADCGAKFNEFVAAYASYELGTPYSGVVMGGMRVGDMLWLTVGLAVYIVSGGI